MSWTGENRTAISEALRQLSLYGGNEKAAKVVSAYYSGVTTEYELWRQALWRLDHLWWAFWWSRHAIHYAVELLDAEILQVKAGLTNLTADEVDVLCTVLRRLKGAKYDAKLRVLLDHLVWYPDPAAEPFSRAFILMHRVRMGVTALNEMVELQINELAATTQLSALNAKQNRQDDEAMRLYGQAARIYRQLADLVPERKSQYLVKASVASKIGGVVDQLLKLSAS